MGRITLNPAAHFDPLGFFLFVLIALGYPAFAWGKPVPVNPNRLRGNLRQRKIAMGVVAFAGPLSNVVMATAAAIPFRIARNNNTNLGDWDLYVRVFILVIRQEAVVRQVARKPGCSMPANSAIDDPHPSPSPAARWNR